MNANTLSKPSYSSQGTVFLVAYNEESSEVGKNYF